MRHDQEDPSSPKPAGSRWTWLVVVPGAVVAVLSKECGSRLVQRPPQSQGDALVLIAIVVGIFIVAAGGLIFWSVRSSRARPPAKESGDKSAL